MPHAEPKKLPRQLVDDKINFGLPRLTIPKRLAAPTCSTTNLPSHIWTIACRQREIPKSSLYVEDEMASHSEKYSLAIYMGPDIVCPPHAKSLASVAIWMDTPFSEGEMSDSKRSRGS